MNTYEILKELSKEKKISIRQLEMKFGYSNGYLAKWKNNTPNSEELIKLADYFDVTVDYLLGRTDERTVNINSDEEYSDLIMMFRKGEKIVPENKKEDYRKQVKNLMNYIAQSMDDEDDE
ncbi:hypothetical protein A5819_000009 [Enterococcus sp. 7E2_DIV0204]|uniref:helix-turn-helix domain-containing protein n=1 Tax=unclassified Enterococcus TaxID=2608891 RepID=UPI000A32BC1D|nr:MULTISPECIES: helix-turn-helix transcriptional regulator [unclassified Enterococcus]OTN87563.1 hypothetical protein A5819_000009 [Enterococcus sp. 7E2_DIV0204]OTP49751.1 hypothetical protein A5884_002951 [Enterococcus sp. 7D2_DIV0200]